MKSPVICIKSNVFIVKIIFVRLANKKFFKTAKTAKHNFVRPAVLVL